VAGAQGSKLRRELGLTSTTLLIVGSMVGSGIFFGPQAIAAALPNSAEFLLVWVVAGLISLLGALSIAELGAAMPSSGGQYVYVREAFGRFPAFLYGWSNLLAGKSAALAAVAVVFGTFLHFALPWPLGAPGYAVGLIVLLTAINVLGVRDSAHVQNVSTALKVLGLLAVIAVGLLAGSRGAGLDPLLPEGLLGAGLVGAFAIALVPALFAYDGWYFAAQVAEEVKDPGRTLPRGIILGTLAVMVLYLLINVAYVSVLGPAGLAATGTAEGAHVANRQSPAVAVMDLLLGPAGVALVVGAVLVSTLGTTNAITLTGPRIYFAMARDGLFFRSFARVHPRFRTPHVAIVLQGAFGALLAASGTFAQLILVEVFATYLFLALAVAAVFVLRRERPTMARPYRTPGYPWVPALFLASIVVFAAAAIWAEPILTGAFLLLLALGVPLFLHLEARQPRRPKGLREVVLADRP
jgi:basic amino acid/polyamine antiporter, APA family